MTPGLLLTTRAFVEASSGGALPDWLCLLAPFGESQNSHNFSLKFRLAMQSVVE